MKHRFKYKRTAPVAWRMERQKLHHQLDNCWPFRAGLCSERSQPLHLWPCLKSFIMRISYQCHFPQMAQAQSKWRTEKQGNKAFIWSQVKQVRAFRAWTWFNNPATEKPTSPWVADPAPVFKLYVLLKSLLRFLSITLILMHRITSLSAKLSSFTHGSVCIWQSRSNTAVKQFCTKQWREVTSGLCLYWQKARTHTRQ